ncbi:hypothetical protein IFM89_007000, partial [Coptis chinensis]
ANGDNDITLKILYCGICHSDLHSIKNEWGNAAYPIIPGHEIVGIVTEVGSNVTKCKIAAALGLVFTVGWIFYFIGYSTCDPNNHMKAGYEIMN